MTELLTAAQMRAIEQAAITSGEVTGLELMERAGAGVVEAVFEEWPDLAAGSFRAVVLCGPGNNGGDGFVVARLLKERGWEVEVFLYGDPERLPPDARVNHERWVGIGEVGQLTDDTAFDASNPHLCIDALFGTGLDRPIEALGGVLGGLHGLAHSTSGNKAGVRGACKVVAVDLPSGLCSDTGKAFKRSDRRRSAHDAASAHLVVTFHAMKLGHMLAEGPLNCGKVVVHDIGLSKTGSGKGTIVQGVCGSARLEKHHAAHKYTHGHALILSGPSGKGGAGRLAARGALRIGAGLVTLGCPPDAVPENAAQLNAIMLVPVHDADALGRVLEDARINALCLGPGMGGDRARELVPAALRVPAPEPGPRPGGPGSGPGRAPGSGPGRAPGSGPGRAVVLDADALTGFADDPDTLFAILHETCVLTPHHGEFARLFPDIAEKLAEPATTGPAYSKVDATREAAKRAGCTVLFKGPDTVIASPDGRAAINSSQYDRAAPWMATAGSGDVLAGFVTGLLARGFAPQDAAATAAWLHTECALGFGPGLIAEDLPEALPKVFRQLGL